VLEVEEVVVMAVEILVVLEDLEEVVLEGLILEEAQEYLEHLIPAVVAEDLMVLPQLQEL
jgi:hypothetical protein